ncbi:MAG TPA: ATP-binding protein [Caulobacteraceae bacterium]|nr:ATP-binding protein [Caulobacteraceae bacterium]
MLSRSLWRTTTFRLTLLFGAVFASGIALLLSLVYAQTAGYLTRRADRTLVAEAKVLERSGPDFVIRRFQQEVARDPLNSLGLFSADGERVAGDTTLKPSDLPLDGRPRDAPHRRGAAPSRAMAERTPWGEILIVERDTRQLVALRRIIVGALWWSGGAIALLGLFSAVALSLRPLTRVAAMRRASDAISAGDFALRLPITGSGDELDELAQITNRMMDEAERLMIEARTVGQGLAHELRSPLTRLRTMLDHASASFEADDPRRRLLENCVAETDALLTRFQALLRIAALEARGRRTAIERVSLSDMTQQIAELYAPLAADLRIELTASADAGLVIHGDGELLFEAVSNLVDNALKFSGAGGHVSVSAVRGPDGARLEVKDDGQGIPEAERPLVTKRFYRGQRHAATPGHGLGLSLVAAVADLHGFDLSFHDAHPGALVRITVGRDALAAKPT